MSKGTVAVIGAGVVGAALFREFTQRGYEVVLLERHGRPCQETSSRNSGVLHAGLYYPLNSLKTKLCVQGNRLFREFAREKNLLFWDYGKLIVGPKEDEAEIAHIFKQAQDNDVPKCRRVTQKEIHRLEPDIAGEVGMLSETSALIDPHTFVDAMILDGETAGGMVITDCEVKEIEAKGNGFRIHTQRDDLEVDGVLNAAGLEAIRVAQMVGVQKYTYHYCRGDYFVVTGAKYKINHLVYPTPDHQHQALGVHITPDPDGRLRLGPDATYIDDPIHVKDGADEASKQRFYEGAKRLLPTLQLSQLHYDMWGIRPKLKPMGTQNFSDFVIEECPQGAVHLIGIESPGLTAALAIGKYVAEKFF